MAFYVDRQTGERVQLRYERMDRTGRYSPIIEKQDPAWLATIKAVMLGIVAGCALAAVCVVGLVYAGAHP